MSKRNVMRGHTAFLIEGEDERVELQP